MDFLHVQHIKDLYLQKLSPDIKVFYKLNSTILTLSLISDFTRTHHLPFCFKGLEDLAFFEDEEVFFFGSHDDEEVREDLDEAYIPVEFIRARW